jgi:hypothetical protein
LGLEAWFRRADLEREAWDLPATSPGRGAARERNKEV